MTRTRTAAGAGLGGLAAWLLVGGVPGIACAILVGGGVLAVTWFRGKGTAGDLADQCDPAAERATVHLGACLAAGATMAEALAAAAGLADEQIARPLRQVRLGLLIGVEGTEAWRPMADAGPLASIAARVSDADASGVSVARALERLASELSARRHSELVRQARLAPLRVLGPLGLCFLPAFVLVGVLPVVLGLARAMLEVR